MKEKPLPVLGAHEIRERLGSLSRQRVYQLTGRADFPAPVADLMQGKVWLASDVDLWIKEHRTTPRAGQKFGGQKRPEQPSG